MVKCKQYASEYSFNIDDVLSAWDQCEKVSENLNETIEIMEEYLEQKSIFLESLMGY